MSGPFQTTPGPEQNRDAITVQELASGNPEGLQHLLQDHGGLIKSLLRQDFGRVLDDSELDEVMNTMVAKVWKAAARFDAAQGTLRAWATAIARNSALNYLENRRRDSQRPTPDLDRFAIAVAAPTSPTSDRQRLLADLHRCIELLPTLQRAVLTADLEAGDAVAAGPLAKLHGTTANSIYVSRLKGRIALRKSLADLGHTLSERRPAAGKPALEQPPYESRADQE